LIFISLLLLKTKIRTYDGSEGSSFFLFYYSSFFLKNNGTIVLKTEKRIKKKKRKFRKEKGISKKEKGNSSNFLFSLFYKRKKNFGFYTHVWLELLMSRHDSLSGCIMNIVLIKSIAYGLFVCKWMSGNVFGG